MYNTIVNRFTNIIRYGVWVVESFLLKDNAIASTKNSRNYGIDALRILSMFFVLVLHVLGHGGVLSNTVVFTSQYEVAWFLEIGTYCAVNCYAVISGYVGVNSKYKYSSIATLWFRVLFYSFSITLLFKILGIGSIGYGVLLFSAMPVLSGQYWYFTAYFAMFMFIPLLNTAINKLNKRQLGILIFTMFFLFSCTSICKYVFGESFKLSGGYSAWWLIILYIFGGYIKRYDLFQKIKRYVWLILHFTMVILTWLSKLILEIRPVGVFNSNILVSYISPTITLSAICLLMFFKDLEFKSVTNKIITFLSPLAFSVYLIHNHPLINKYMIKDSLSSLANLPAIVLPFAVIGVSLGIFIVCCAIDLIREQLFKVLKIKQRLNNLEYKYIGDLWKT